MSDGPSNSMGSERTRERQIVDDTDRALLRALTVDGRMPVAELARRANVSRANAYARLERLRSSGVIEGFTVRVDPHAIGLEVSALIFLTVDQARWPQIRDFLAGVPEVEFVGLAAGDFDFVALVRTTSVDTLRDVVLQRFHGIPEVRDTRTVLLLDHFAREPSIP